MHAGAQRDDRGAEAGRDDAGKDFEVVVVSIDPKDNFRLAANKKQAYVDSYGRPASAAGFHFLTGQESSIKPLAEALGFRYAYDANIKQYAHGAAIYVATPKGVVSRYLLGIDFAPRDVRLALVEASNNTLGTVRDKILLFATTTIPRREATGPPRSTRFASGSSPRWRVS